MWPFDQGYLPGLRNEGTAKFQFNSGPIVARHLFFYRASGSVMVAPCDNHSSNITPHGVARERSEVDHFVAFIPIQLRVDAPILCLGTVNVIRIKLLALAPFFVFSLAAKAQGVPKEDFLTEVDNQGSTLLHMAVESGTAKASKRLPLK